MEWAGQQKKICLSNRKYLSICGKKGISIWGKIKIIGFTYLLHVYHCSIISSTEKRRQAKRPS